MFCIQSRKALRIFLPPSEWPTFMPLQHHFWAKYAKDKTFFFRSQLYCLVTVQPRVRADAGKLRERKKTINVCKVFLGKETFFLGAPGFLCFSGQLTWKCCVVAACSYPPWIKLPKWLLDFMYYFTVCSEIIPRYLVLIPRNSNNSLLQLLYVLQSFLSTRKQMFFSAAQPTVGSFLFMALLIRWCL